jgi:ABC-type branched-subunit amino acid transport system substrate-binding protein
MKRALLALALAPALLWAGDPPQSDPNQRERGRQIYVDTTSPSGGEIVAILGAGEAEIEVDGLAVPCSGCHGRDGRGRPEGGVTPTDITWDYLSKPYGNVHYTGRKIPSYDEKGLERAIAGAVDPSGFSFHVAMPRYRMSRQDMDDLLAYMKVLGRPEAPGVTGRVLRIGVVLPPAGPLEPMGRAVRDVLATRFDHLNGQGGMYGRRIEPVFVETSGTPVERRNQVDVFLEREPVFAAVAPFFAGADAELAAVFQERRVPVLGPFTLHPREDDLVNRYIFYLLPGMQAQGQALARFVRDTSPSGKAAIVAPEGQALDAAVQAIALACGGEGETTILRYGREAFRPLDAARELSAKQAGAVIFLGSGPEAVALMRAAGPLGWRPRLLVTAAASDPTLYAAPKDFAGRIFVGLPAQPEHLSAEQSALGAAEVLLEGLRRTGRDLDRESFIEKLEGFRHVPTGYTPPVTYGPSRRLGARGAYVLALDLDGRKLVQAAGWVDVE